MPFPAIWRPKFQKGFPQCPTDSTNSKETQSLGKNGCREKCLDKSLPWEDIFKLGDSAAASEFCEWVQVGIDVYIPH